MRTALTALTLSMLAVTTAQAAGSGTYAIRLLTPETALKAVNAAVADCRKRGFQVAVAVVDRSGVAQALLRDRLAGPHTVQTAINKGYTAISFRTDTLEFARLTAPQSLASGIRQIPNVIAVGGGVQISAGGQLLGAIGVSGAPTGEADELCAKAGIEAIRDDIEL
jgi:uncharacterized protein GlcG (DUF336 family)